MTIRTETEDTVGWIIIDRPAQKNALTTAMWDDIPRAVAKLDADDSVRAIILRGAGDDAFAAGADIRELHQMGDDPKALADFEDKFEAAQASLEDCSKPVIAAIQGPCMGGGLALALACDMRMAAVEATFAIPAARLGLGYAAPAVARLTRAVGPTNAFEILATARRYDSLSAHRLGLINDRLPDWDVFRHAEQVATHMGRNAPLTLHAAKATITALNRQDGSLQAAEELIMRCGSSEDFAEGRKAFTESREPKFQGR